MDNLPEITELLEANGIVPTPQRLAVAGILLTRPQHMTAEQVHARVNSEARKVSVATIYNTLKLFTERGLLREVIVEPGRIFYDSTTAPHHHFHDVGTGRISDIPADAVGFESLPAIPQGSELVGVDVVIRVRSRN